MPIVQKHRDRIVIRVGRQQVRMFVAVDIRRGDRMGVRTPTLVRRKRPSIRHPALAIAEEKMHLVRVMPDCRDIRVPVPVEIRDRERVHGLPDIDPPS
jgi:hypothetical protein